jgi:hypothetical protein
MTEFHDRVAIRRALVDQPELWFWTPAFEAVMAWVEQQCEPGDTVLELGCGLGFFMHALRRRGFNPVGLDVALQAVELNRADGFEVWHGTLDTMPEGWVEPKVVVAFFMLHHLEAPLAFLREVRRRWPNAGLAIAQYGESNVSAASTPPRTLTRWNARSMHQALLSAGYAPDVREFAGSGAQRGVMQPVRRALKRSLAIPPLYRFLRRIEQSWASALLSPMAKPQYVLLSLAEPVSEPASVTDENRAVA